MAARVRKPAEGRTGPCGSEDTESREPTTESGVSRSPGESHALHTGVLVHTGDTNLFHFAEWCCGTSPLVTSGQCSAPSQNCVAPSQCQC